VRSKLSSSVYKPQEQHDEDADATAGVVEDTDRGTVEVRIVEYRSSAGIELT